MRFEIGPGGMLFILLGLAGLSAAVFGLGLVAGHELAGPEPGSQPAVASYPLPASPPAAVAAAPPAPAASASGVASGSNAGGAASAAAAPPPAAASAVKPPPPAVANVAPRRPANAGSAAPSRSARSVTARDEDLSTGAAVAPPDTGSAFTEPGDTGGDEGSRPASAAPAPPRRIAAVNPSSARPASGPYSVQIDAMMDLAGARQMAQKIRAKGFEPYIVPTNVDGKTWYRLRVGHYATPEQAQAAESKLHQEFNDNAAGN